MITLRNLTLRRSAHVVLQDASVTLHPGEKVGLVGRNGAGKSSLFALLSGELHEDAGALGMPAGWRMAQVAQGLPDTEASATAFVLTGDSALTAAQQALEHARRDHDGEAEAHAWMLLHDAGAHDAEARAQALLGGLGFAPEETGRPVNSFSGGWRMRLQLARALMAPCDLLLLDEPTNHLDLDALVWLEGWLRRFDGTLIVISHDREFLDAVTNVTVHLEQTQLNRYGGNYSQFEVTRAAQLANQQAALTRQAQHAERLHRFIERFKAKASKAKQAQSRVKALERMERLAPLLAEAELDFDFATPASLPNPMLKLREADIGYAGDAAPKIVVSGVTVTVLPGQRIGILGANGQGKTSLVKTIAGVLPPLGGRLIRGKGLAVGYFAQQELDVLRPGESALDHLRRLARELGQAGELCGQDTRDQALRDVLGRFLFPGEQALRPVDTFSGGERARLLLALLVWQRPNLLLLDEPTNHLDLSTRDVLSEAINGFDGSVMLVSHDRALLRSVCDSFWIVARGRLSPFEGDMDDYQQHLQEIARERRDALRKAIKPQAPAGEAPRTGPSAAEQRREDARKRQALAAAAKPLQREIAGIDQRLADIEREQTTLHERLSQGGTPDALAQAGRALKALEQDRETLEARWLELAQALEELQAPDPADAA